ncbi:peroxygenase 1 [Striga asiatica]|uniref:Peroxygenase 1 n=1 Tax=Striga asiatica TaxID=4170 RepID=A0A5A7PKV3_STRAF|nr:peroxygenase 1 [Striga asiatica]
MASTIVAAAVDRNAAMASDAPLAPVTLERPVRTDLETTIPKPYLRMRLFQPWYPTSTRDGREERVINVENPRVSPIFFQTAVCTKINRALVDCPFRVNLVLSRAHVFANVLDAFLRDNLEIANVVQLHINSPALTIVLQCDLEATFGYPLVHNIVSHCLLRKRISMPANG